MKCQLPGIFLDRDGESRLLHEAILKRESLWIGGSAGIGKTSLVLKALGDFPPHTARSLLYFSDVGGLRDFLRRTVGRLFEVNDPTLRRQMLAEGVTNVTFRAWLCAQSTSRLKGCLYRAAEKNPYWIFLDHVPVLTLAVAKVMKELVNMRRTPVYLVVRDFTGGQAGCAHEIYWNKSQRLMLTPLSRKVACEVLDYCINYYGLLKMDLKRFRARVLRWSGQIPGAIAEMCKLAAEPRYQFGTEIKTKLLYIDYLMKGSEGGEAAHG